MKSQQMISGRYSQVMVLFNSLGRFSAEKTLEGQTASTVSHSYHNLISDIDLECAPQSIMHCTDNFFLFKLRRIFLIIIIIIIIAFCESNINWVLFSGDPHSCLYVWKILYVQIKSCALLYLRSNQGWDCWKDKCILKRQGDMRRGCMFSLCTSVYTFFIQENRCT